MKIHPEFLPFDEREREAFRRFWSHIKSLNNRERAALGRDVLLHVGRELVREIVLGLASPATKQAHLRRSLSPICPACDYTRQLIDYAWRQRYSFGLYGYLTGGPPLAPEHSRCSCRSTLTDRSTAILRRKFAKRTK